MDIALIERTRQQMKIPIDRLCAAAEVAPRHYYRLVARRVSPRGSTISRLNMALQRHKIGFGAEAHELAPHAALKATMVLAAFCLKADARAALDADPAQRATSNPEWMAAARVRRVAIYVANQFFGFAQADLARAAGVTRQAVSNAIKELEDERDHDAALKALLDQLEEVFS